MSMYAVSDEILNGIAHAIQGKIGSDEPMTVASMASAIERIPSGDGNGTIWNRWTYELLPITLPAGTISSNDLLTVFAPYVNGQLSIFQPVSIASSGTSVFIYMIISGDGRFITGARGNSKNVYAANQIYNYTIPEDTQIARITGLV